MLEEFLDKVHQDLDTDYVTVKIDIQNMKNGKEVTSRIRTMTEGGIPWMVILKANGDELVTSDGPMGNIGYPLQPAEIEHFMSMLKATSKRTTAEQMAAIGEALNENAKRIQQKLNQRQRKSEPANE